MLNRPQGTTFLLLSLLLASCASTPFKPQERFKTLGTLDLTVGESAGIGKQEFTVASIQLKISANVMLDFNGYRYLSTTYQIRNANSAGTPSPTPKTNVTFLAVDTTNTLNDTAVRSMKKTDGTAASSALATQVVPAGNLTAGGVLSSTQSMQVFSSSETASLTGLPASIETVLPYGFVVDRVGGGRTLDASPISSNYQGTVTLSVKVPLQTPIEDTPTSVTLSMVYTEDSITQVTESPEEKQLGNSGLSARVTAAGASRVNVFPGSTYSGTSRTLCSVPISGGASPTYLINQSQKAVIWPTFSALGSLPATTTPVLVSYCDGTAPVLSGTTPQNQLVIQALQTGKRLSSSGSFNSGTFSESGGQWRYDPAGGAPFKPGEEVEVTAVGGSAALSATQRFRIAGAAEGATGFNAQTTITTGDTPWSVALGDLNGDGKLDMIHPHYDGSSMGVRLGNGDGTFQTASIVTTAANPRTALLGDMNGDGKLDLVLTHTALPGSVGVWLGNGDGTFQTPNVYTAGNGTWGARLGDINLDGKLDVLAANLSGISVSVYLGNGDGTLQSSGTITANVPSGVALGDLNGDGKPDAVVPRFANDSIRVSLGNGDGTFQTPVDYTAGDGPRFVEVADLNADGKLDVVTGNTNTSTISVLLGNGDGTLQSHTTYAAGSGARYPALWDANGDGKIDLLVTNLNFNTVSFLLGNGDGTFQTQTTLAVGTSPQFIALGDVNGDGKVDALVSNSSSDTISILIKK